MKKITALFVALIALGVMSSFAFAVETPKLNAPFIVTTCGQSPGAVMIHMSAMQAKVAASHDNKLTADKLAASGAKTLIVTSGTSMKGMGAAGTNVENEIARCTALIAEAKKLGMTVVGAHIEGMARRTDNSDAASIEAVMKDADAMLVVTDSDSDGFFTKYAKEHNKPLIVVKDALAVGQALKTASE
ncbi:MAG: DUF6305 family protein [Pyramidobacter sp.]|jgi:hypothetical protein